jgi:Delta24-sterol reductase
METLVKATLPHGLLPLVVPEFKGITVGGALMGAAAESSSHRWGIFHDSCTQIYFLDGRGMVVRASHTENEDLFYGLSGSYGSLGLLIKAELALIPVKNSVQITYHVFPDAAQALEKMETLIGTCDFLDGILFAKDHGVIMEGHLIHNIPNRPSPHFFAHKVQENRAEKILPLFDYLFRYDQGAFWMANFLFSPRFLLRYLTQGFLDIWPSQGQFTEYETALFKNLPYPKHLCSSSLLSSQRLWGLLHKAEKWVQDRLIIQDFCIPLPNASFFLAEILQDPATFPIWLCPIKGTLSPQVFAPHYGHPFFINFGIYGSPSYSAPMEEIISNLEKKTDAHGGRKVLYSRSYYTEDFFWKIYPRSIYNTLRQKTHSHGIWRDLTDKVLSE